MKNTHAVGASMFFIVLYIHIARNIYFQKFLNIPVWLSGLLIFLLTMATAFLGYVLP
jgi:ubiquinol-cytochrome c reductase cytochrome b subunit